MAFISDSGRHTSTPPVDLTSSHASIPSSSSSIARHSSINPRQSPKRPASTKSKKSVNPSGDSINLSALNLTSTSKQRHSSAPKVKKPKEKESKNFTFLGLATLARDKASPAVPSLKNPDPRSQPSPTGIETSQSSQPSNSNSDPSKSSHSARTSRSNFTAISQEVTAPPLPSSNDDISRRSSVLEPEEADLAQPSQSPLDTKPPQSVEEEHIDSEGNSQSTVFPRPTNYNKMHQTSSRLLRMTDDERPFTRDFKDLFATLVVSMPLASHRVRLTRIEHSFMSEEAINNLGSLKFSQSNRMPDPKDPSRIVTTTTTTTFSMAREMARSVCQRFLEARFIESADGKQQREFTMRGSVWQLTPKGIHVLDRFCSRNGIQQKHVSELLGSPRNTMQLVILERDSQSDKLSQDRSTIEVIFRRFIGAGGPNVKSNTTSADSDSLSEYKDGMLGVKMANERKIGNPSKTFSQTFTGKAATDWLMDCCTVVDRRETTEIAALFVEHDLIWAVLPDRQHMQQFPQDVKFQPTKYAIYQMTPKGKDVLSMTQARPSHGDEPLSARGVVSRDSNTQKLDKMLLDPALRLLFRENLRDTHCEENLSFYLDVDEFLRSCKIAIKAISQNQPSSKPNHGMDAIKETMASAYGIYNAFLAPGSPCELNIDHTLRNQLATRMTKSVGQDQAMIESLMEVTKLFEEAQISVFKLMASDSVPKFMKNAKYEHTLRNYDFDAITVNGVATNASNSGSRTATAPLERNTSRSAR